MPVSLHQELQSYIINEVNKLVETFRASLGSYIYLLQNPHCINEYLFPVGQLASRRIELISPRDKFENDEMNSFSQLAISIVKFELLQKLLITVMSKMYADSLLYGAESFRNELYKCIINCYCTNDNEMNLWSIKLNVTDAHLANLFAGIILNPLDFLFKNMIEHHHEQLLLYFELFNLDKSSYQFWSYTKKLGHMIGFKLPKPHTFAVELVVRDRLVGTLDLNPDVGTDSENGFNWILEILNNFLRNNIKENDVNIINDVNSLLRSYKTTSFTNNNNELLFHYNNHEAVSIPGNWYQQEGHAVGIALYRNLLIYCNRGTYAGFETHRGIYIYQLNKKPTIETFDSLLKIHPSIEDFTNALSQIVTNLKTPNIIMPLKKQNRGNCAFANSKSLMKGLLFCFAYERNKALKLSEDDAILSAGTYAHKLYKRITSDMRDTVMLDLATTINFVTQINKLKFIAILSLLIIEHHPNPKQQDRIYKSLNILTLAEVGAVFDNIRKYNFKKDLTDDFVDNLLQKYTEQRIKCAIQPPQRPITSIAKFFGPKPQEVKNPNDICVADLSVVSENKATIIAIDKDRLNRIKRTLESCIRMSSTDGGEHKLNFSIKKTKGNILSLFCASKNELIMEGDIARGLECLKTFLDTNTYMNAVKKLAGFTKKSLPHPS